MKKDIWKLISLLVLVSMLLSACAAPKEKVLKVATQQVREHWTTEVHLGNLMEAQYRKIMTDVSAGFSTLKLGNKLTDDCFTNTDEVNQNALESRYGSTATDETRPDGSFDKDAYINAFVVNENYPGDVTVCQNMVSDQADRLSTWNADKADNFGVFWDITREYDNHISDDIVKSMSVDFAQWAAAEAEKAGFGYLSNYVYPSFEMTIETRDPEICAYYAQDTIRGDCTWNPVLDNGTLSGQGAYDYMTRLFVAPEVSAAFDAGADTLDPFGDE